MSNSKLIEKIPFKTEGGRRYLSQEQLDDNQWLFFIVQRLEGSFQYDLVSDCYWYTPAEERMSNLKLH